MNYIVMFKWSLLFCVVAVLFGCLFHRPAYYPAQILMKDGVPCFSVANRRKERANTPIVSTVNVFPLVGKEAIWIGMFPPDLPPMILPPHECLVYGVGTENAPPLRRGYRYGVSMITSINGYRVAYQSYFCLSGAPDGNETEIHHVKWNRELNGFDWRVCGDKD